MTYIAGRTGLTLPTNNGNIASELTIHTIYYPDPRFFRPSADHRLSIANTGCVCYSGDYAAFHNTALVEDFKLVLNLTAVK